MAGIFKAYDIRGIYGRDLTDEIATRIGRAFVELLGCRTVVVGQDVRHHSEPLFMALSRGITEQGADVIKLRPCSTPMCYFANGRLSAGASVMITASHNPAPWNGFKLCRENAMPISGDSGIADIERLVDAGLPAAPAARHGTITEHDIGAEYAAHIQAMAALARPLRIAADFANGMGVHEAEGLQSVLDIEPLFAQLDGGFPNHEANPLNPDTLIPLRARIRAGQFAFGAAFDGDGDRVGFVDERGEIVPMDLIGGLIAGEMLRREKGVVLYDLRSSRAVPEFIAENGGTPVMSRVGHSFIKRQMRERNAIFACELSGHYYFRENYTSESAAAAVISVANALSRSGLPLSELIRPLRRYFASGEKNLKVRDPGRVLARLRDHYANSGGVAELDGVSVAFDDWWFNVRPSNTEPLVRVNLEATTLEGRDHGLAEVMAFLRRADDNGARRS